MGEHKGWRIQPRGGGWLARVWDPDRKAYRSKKFPAAAHPGAVDWAEREAAKYRLGLVPIGQCPTGAYLEGYLGELKRRRRSDSHRSEVRQVLQALAAAVPDLADPRATTQARAWATSLATGTRVRRGRFQGEPPVTYARSAATINRALSHARAFGRWLVEEERLTVSPLNRVKSVRGSKSLRPMFTVDEVRQLLACIDDPLHPRLVLWAYFGMRSSEASTWRRRGGVLLVRGKGDKERIVPIPAEVLACKWLPIEPPPVWGRVRSRRALLAVMARCGIPVARRSPHSLRHTWASLQCATGESLPIVQDRAGHTSPSTTSHYARLAAAFPEARSWPRGEIEFVTGWAEPVR